MKITKERLKQIIKEEVGGFQSTDDAAAADADTRREELKPTIKTMLEQIRVQPPGAEGIHTPEGGSSVYELLPEHDRKRVVDSMARHIANDYRFLPGSPAEG